MTYRPLPLWFVASLSLLLAGCGGGGGGQPFVDCGNGVVDSGEECDDGGTCSTGQNAGAACTASEQCPGGACVPSDEDGCLGTCVLARCGDGFVQEGVEECDLNRLAGRTCASFNLAGDGLACSADCTYDTSGCGDPIDTPTPTATPPPTATATATATPAVTSCGNGLLEPGETCASCAADCTALPCEATTTRAAFEVQVTAGSEFTSVVVDLAYRSNLLSLPGTGNAGSVRERFTNLPTGGQTQINDRDYSARVVKSRTSALPQDRLFSVSFDTCANAALPTVDDLACTISSCSDEFSLPIGDCTCRVRQAP